MFKNVASQKIKLFAFDVTTGLPKTGDAANITAYVSKDNGAVTVLADTSATELDATNAKGIYMFDLAQAETNGDDLLFTAKSSTSNIVIKERNVYTTPNHFSSAVIDAAGLIDANAVKMGPSGSGTALTARDVGASVLLAVGTGTGQINLIAGQVGVQSNVKKNQALPKLVFGMTENVSGQHNPATGKTVTVTRSLDGGTASVGGITNVLEMANGLYSCDLAAGDMNAAVVTIRATATGCDDNDFSIITTP